MNHDLVSNTPVISQIVDSVHVAWDSIVNLRKGKPNLPDPSDDTEIIDSPTIRYIPYPTIARSEMDHYFPEAISRSTSGSSSGSSTVRGSN